VRAGGDTPAMRGIDSATQAVYRLMLTDHQLGVEELSSRLGMSESEVRAALDQLADLRLLRPSDEVPGEAPGGLLPVDPRVGLAALLQHNESQRQRREQEFEESQAAITRLLAEYRDESASEHNHRIERLIGMATVQARLEELTRSISTECLAFSPGGARSAASLEASRPLNMDALTRGVRMRTVFLDSVRKDRATAGTVRTWPPSSVSHSACLAVARSLRTLSRKTVRMRTPRVRASMLSGRLASKEAAERDRKSVV